VNLEQLRLSLLDGLAEHTWANWDVGFLAFVSGLLFEGCINFIGLSLDSDRTDVFNCQSVDDVLMGDFNVYNSIASPI
jgi:hypothetical protein